MKQLLGMMAVAIGAMLVLNGPAWGDEKGKGLVGRERGHWNSGIC